MSEIHYSVDQYPVTVGAKFWNNDLRVCEITEVAAHSNDYPGGYVQTWHRTTNGSFDTVAPHHPNLGRLVRFYEGKDAERFEAGTNFNELFPPRR
ncbi:MAG TPA: hypothetical protein VH164_11245 [Ktedonobacteraceae bacterium]|jgi:hypothetical protein|nr:hypothetical protein [Ktedonobacteraceae bacterium]